MLGFGSIKPREHEIKAALIMAMLFVPCWAMAGEVEDLEYEVETLRDTVKELRGDIIDLDNRDHDHYERPSRLSKREHKRILKAVCAENENNKYSLMCRPMTADPNDPRLKDPEKYDLWYWAEHGWKK